MGEANVNDLFPIDAQPDVDARLEAIAVEIEMTQAAAVLRVAERLTEAHGLFKYKHEEHGFTGWVERRLKTISVATAYRLLHVHSAFGQKCLSELETFPRFDDAPSAFQHHATAVRSAFVPAEAFASEAMTENPVMEHPRLQDGHGSR
jgi:hypothetical protein